MNDSREVNNPLLNQEWKEMINNNLRREMGLYVYEREERDRLNLMMLHILQDFGWIIYENLSCRVITRPAETGLKIDNGTEIKSELRQDVYLCRGDMDTRSKDIRVHVFTYEVVGVEKGVRIESSLFPDSIIFVRDETEVCRWLGKLITQTHFTSVIDSLSEKELMFYDDTIIYEWVKRPGISFSEKKGA